MTRHTNTHDRAHNSSDAAQDVRARDNREERGSKRPTEHKASMDTTRRTHPHDRVLMDYYNSSGHVAHHRRLVTLKCLSPLVRVGWVPPLLQNITRGEVSLANAHQVLGSLRQRHLVIDLDLCEHWSTDPRVMRGSERPTEHKASKNTT